VLRARGADDAVAGAAIRVSLGWASAAADVDHFIQAWGDLYARSTAARALHSPAA
jgi:cysteine desulfurase